MSSKPEIETSTPAVQPHPSIGDAPIGDPQPSGLTDAQVRARLAEFGPNVLPEPAPSSPAWIFLRQFLSPLIYILLLAAAVSVLVGDIRDALFIVVVLLANGAIGTIQEYSAARAAAALRRLEEPRATVVRNGLRQEVPARDLVPGDTVLLESGGRVPADLDLNEIADMRIDESLLTGESVAVQKETRSTIEPAFTPATRALAGTLVTRGRARGVVTATGAKTEIGRIAETVGEPQRTQPPLLVRLDRFSRLIACAVAASLVLLSVAGYLRGMALADLFMMSVGLAVAAIPEGLPVAISIALALGMRRMARAHVIVRNMAAVEALGSCTMIASDKTGTLTMNELTVTEVVLPDGTVLVLNGHGAERLLDKSLPVGADGGRRMQRLLRAATLPNEAQLVADGDGWKGLGDTVDVALLRAARRAGLSQTDAAEGLPSVGRIPYETHRRYAASFHASEGRIRIFVKGAAETLIAMTDRMNVGDAAVPVDRRILLAQKDVMAARGLRVLAFAEGEIATTEDGSYEHEHLMNLVFIGFAGMRDPIRPEVPGAILACRRAGIEVAMVTGDDPQTAAAVAAEAGLAFFPDQVVSGDVVARAEEEGEGALDHLTRNARIYARVAPGQKLAIVLSLARNGHFVAVTGDGVNDAPALRHAHVGVAMGCKGTDLAKETADIVVTDDNFASIIEGIREGRVVYANIRKLVFMLVSTGAAEVALFLLAIPTGLPMPLLPVQLLWLNLVTNGIQDVALAAEPAEGDELARPPRPPREAIFDRVMLRRVVQSTLIMGGGGFAVFAWLLAHGHPVEEARNLLLLLFVLFENFQTFNSRSERASVFGQPFSANPLLVIGVAATQGLQILAMHLTSLGAVIGSRPVTLRVWIAMLLIAATLLLAMELDKRRERRAVSSRKSG